jgi:hypothetical protein
MWYLNRLLSKYVGFLVAVLFHQCSILIFIYMLLLPEGQMGEIWEPDKNVTVPEIGEHWVGKYLYFVFSEIRTRHASG